MLHTHKQMLHTHTCILKTHIHKIRYIDLKIMNFRECKQLWKKLSLEVRTLTAISTWSHSIWNHSVVTSGCQDVFVICSWANLLHPEHHTCLLSLFLLVQTDFSGQNNCLTTLWSVDNLLVDYSLVSRQTVFSSLPLSNLFPGNVTRLWRVSPHSPGCTGTPYIV